MRERLLFIYNPNAGKAKVKEKLSDIIGKFAENGYEVIAMPTAKRGDATAFAREYAGDGACSRIVCAGGDGTLNEVVTGVIQSGRRVPVGYIPAGTTNDFGYSLRIPEDMLKAAELAAKAGPVPSDVGEICGNTFVYTSAFGLFSDVSYDTPQDMKNLFGRVAYILRGVRSLHNVRNYAMSVEYLAVEEGENAPEPEETEKAMKAENEELRQGEEDAEGAAAEAAEKQTAAKEGAAVEAAQEQIAEKAAGELTAPYIQEWRSTEGEFICGMISNSNSVGGFKGIMGKGVRFDDGVFEMLLIRRPHNLRELMDIVNELISKGLNSDNIVYAHVREVRIHAQGDLSWSLDGEFGGNMPQAEIHIREQAVDYIRRRR